MLQLVARSVWGRVPLSIHSGWVSPCLNKHVNDVQLSCMDIVYRSRVQIFGRRGMHVVVDTDAIFLSHDETIKWMTKRLAKKYQLVNSLRLYVYWVLKIIRTDLLSNDLNALRCVTLLVIMYRHHDVVNVYTTRYIDTECVWFCPLSPYI